MEATLNDANQVYVVTVRDRCRESDYDYGPHFEHVVIGTHCPECGGKRGVPRSQRFCEDGEWYSVDVWDDPCGHIDSYVEVLEEARLLGVEL